MSISAEQAFWKHMSYLPSIGSFLSMTTRKPGFNSMPIGRIRNRSLRLSSPATSNKLMLIIGGCRDSWSSGLGRRLLRKCSAGEREAHRKGRYARAHDLGSHQSSFRTVKRNRLALRPSPEHRQSAPAIGVGEPPSDLMTQGAVNALRIGAPLSTCAVTFQ